MSVLLAIAMGVAISALVLLLVWVEWARAAADRTALSAEREPARARPPGSPPQVDAASPSDAPRREAPNERFLRYAEFSGDLGHTTTIGRPSDHARGVLYQAAWEHPFDGFQEHARRIARALANAGVPVHLRSIAPTYRVATPGSEEERVEATVSDLTNASISVYAATVIQVIPHKDVLARLAHPTALAAQVYTDEQWSALLRSRVLYTVYERGPIPASDAACLSKFGQVWVACQRDAAALVEAGLDHDRVRVVPVCFAPDDPMLALRSRGRDRGPTRFYHVGKWEPRKDARGIILAFMRAFRPGQAELYLKCLVTIAKFPGYPETPEDAVADALKDASVARNGWTAGQAATWITIQKGIMPASEIPKIHAWGDVYVSLSHGEGFDMPAFDARLAGNLLVYTPSGGPQDFAGAHDIRVRPRVEPEPAHPGYAWGEEARWLALDVHEAVTALRTADARVQSFPDSTPEWRAEALDLGSEYMSSFSAREVGRRVRQHLQDLAGEIT